MYIKSALFLSLVLPMLFGYMTKKYHPASDSGKAVLLPSKFIDGGRFYIKMPTVAGDTILGFCDTGSGICFVPPPVIDKLKLKKKVKNGDINGLYIMKYIPFNDLVLKGNTPAPEHLPGTRLNRYFHNVADPYVLVLPMDAEMKYLLRNMSLDVFLGQDYFMGKSWTIDYIHRQLWTNTPLSPSEAGVQKIGFSKNKKGEMKYGLPSTTIEVDGEQIDVLFDTGASIILSDSGKKTFSTNKKTIGGSFISASVFDKWHKAHPNWKVYAKADRVADIIEVPKVKIGSCEVGPVLFAKRPDETWSKNMIIGSMDKVVKGAIGGSGLKYLKVTIDYNSELIRFEN